MADPRTSPKHPSWRRSGNSAAAATAAAGLRPEQLRPITDAEAESIQASYDCDGLAAHLRASPHIFGNGWGFASVVWGRRGRPLPYDQVPPDSNKWEYLALEVGNKWNDLALYRRTQVRKPVRRRLFPAEEAAAACGAAAAACAAPTAAGDTPQADPQLEDPSQDEAPQDEAPSHPEPEPEPEPGPHRKKPERKARK